MATMPSRVVALRDTINTILPQCDELNLYLNNFINVPEFLGHQKIKLYRSQDEWGDIGDVGKFYRVNLQQGYIFTVDDKIIYPADYVQQMVTTIERAHRKAVVSNHGRLFHKDKPTKSYYFDTAKNFVYSLAYPLTFVHEIGTGVLAWHSDTCRPDMSWFPHTNMTDIYFSIEVQKRNIPIIIHPHENGWLKLGTKHDENYSIHANCNRKDKFQTSVVNAFSWKINTCPVDQPAMGKSGKDVTFAGLDCRYRVPELDLAIVIPVYNQLEFTRNIFKCLPLTRSKFTVILIDDASTDDTPIFIDEMMKQSAMSIIYRRHETNKGVNASWNEGIRISRAIGANHIAVLNNDLELIKNWDMPMIEMLSDATVGIVCPYSTHGKSLPVNFGTYPGGKNHLALDILGCCFMFRPDLIDTIGYIPDSLVTYYGDNWLQEITRMAGMKVVYAPGSRVHHYFQQTTSKISHKQILADDAEAFNKLCASGLLNNITL
ncbi:MAG TPA: glycosyltransferase [Paludibacteraceae bacterium]|nr:glycosyltransferase [Paludibacteraceae bacterium]